jgi:hypothetical protein
MNLFETIPGNFFSLLSSKNKEIYADALMLLHKLFQHDLNIEKSDFLSALIELIENSVYEIEVDDEEVENVSNPGTKARLILNRFIKTGWVDCEIMDGSFTEVITPKSYAIQVMRLLRDLSETRVREYNSLVYSTYSGLRQAWDNDRNQMYHAVVAAKSNTEQLTYELKTLYHGIRDYLRKIQEQSDVNVLLRDHFDEYKALVDRIYHPIKTMDSIYRYMAPVREILTEVLGDADMMDSLRKRAISVHKYKNDEDAGEELLSAINYVLDVYQSIGGIVNEIDRKHSIYTKLSIDTIRYHMTADQTIAGKLITLLKAYASASVDEHEGILNLLLRGIRVNRQEFLDGRSLWRKNIKSRRVTAEPLAISTKDTISGTEDIRVLDSISNNYSLKRIKEYMNGLLKDRNSVSSREIEIHDNIEFVLLLLATVRAGEKNIDFVAQFGDGWVNTNGYVIPEMTFTKKRSQ